MPKSINMYGDLESQKTSVHLDNITPDPYLHETDDNAPRLIRAWCAYNARVGATPVIDKVAWAAYTKQ